jgi:hypothetical protein
VGHIIAIMKDVHNATAAIQKNKEAHKAVTLHLDPIPTSMSIPD